MKKNIHKIANHDEGIIKAIFKFIHFALTKPGFNYLKKIIKKTTGTSKNGEISYNEWIKAQSDIHTLKNEYEKTIVTLIIKPKFSIVYTVSDLTADTLISSLRSVAAQLYSDWELCVVGTTAINSDVNTIFNNYNKKEQVKIFPDKAKALTAAKGEYILFMAQRDILSPDCLYQFVKHINTLPTDKLIYADEDKVDNEGEFSSPHFKPGWAPDSLMSRNYVGHPLVIKKDLINQLNGFREGFEDCNEYDLLLRATEMTDAVGHIRKVLCHTQADNNAGQNNNCAKKALDEALVRRGAPGNAIAIPDTLCAFYINYTITKPGKVSIIMPTKDHEQLLKKAIDSIMEKTDYPDFEIIVINNNSTSKNFFKLIAEYEKKYIGRFRCINASFPFNFSKLINLGVSESTGTYILMLNNDIEVIHNDWMTKMVSYAQHEKTGAVGVKLLYPDNTIQHAGVILEKEDVTSHIFVNMDRNDARYHNYVRCVNNYSAVTGACLMCRKEVFNEMGGMDEQLPVEYNDVDLCLKMIRKGYYNVYLPMVELYHNESATRGHPFRSKAAWEQHERDVTIFKSKWQNTIDHDPYYNPNYKFGISW